MSLQGHPFTTWFAGVCGECGQHRSQYELVLITQRLLSCPFLEWIFSGLVVSLSASVCVLRGAARCGSVCEWVRARVHLLERRADAEQIPTDLASVIATSVRNHSYIQKLSLSGAHISRKVRFLLETRVAAFLRASSACVECARAVLMGRYYSR